MNLKGKAKWFLQGSAHYLTMYIGYRYAKALPMYFVVGFPRSGTSWLSELIADYYNLPRPRHYYLPIAFASVIHTHFKPNSKFQNTFYIYRDGRDSYTSSYFKSLKLIKEQPDYVKAAHYRQLFEQRTDNPTLRDHQLNFVAFLRDQFNEEHIWSRHITQWQQASRSNSSIAFLSFEKLLSEPAAELMRAITTISGSADQIVLEQVIHRNSFAQQIRRPKSQHRTVLRKGKKNSWRDVFTEDSARLFNEYCGEKMMELGYVNDLNWYTDLTAAPANTPAD